MTTTIALRRLLQQGLVEKSFASPEEVVAWLGAVQAQDYPGAKWALGLRMQQATDDVIDQAFNEGRILRTHVMRPTWHFVMPTEIRWIIELTAPRVNALNAYMYRQQELDDALFARSNSAIAKALEGGKQLTRAELGAALKGAGIDAEGMRLGYIVHRAELDAVVCSGARRGKQFTYALLDERAPQARSLPRDEALAELTKRYFTSHGPATVQDFSWWSGLTIADVKAGIEMVKQHLVQEVIDGQTYWFAASASQPKESAPEALLLPTYDEYIIGYTDRSALFELSSLTTPNASQPAQTSVRNASFLFEGSLSKKSDDASNNVIPNIVFDSMITINGYIVGSWRRTFSKGAVVIQCAPLKPFSADEWEAFDDATQRFGKFLGMPVVLA